MNTPSTARSRAKTALAIIAGALALSSCTGDVSTPTPPSPSSTVAVPGAQQDPQLAAFASHRALDACGLHDPSAAQTVTGDRPDEIMPAASGLDECTLRLAQGEFQSTWTLTVEVGAGFGASQRARTTRETLPGNANVGVFVQASDPRDPDSCALYRELDPRYAIELRASFSAGRSTPPPKPACTVAKDYVAKLAALWASPPKRGAGRTAPDLSLARLDPCQAVSGLLRARPGARLTPESPYRCTVSEAPRPGVPITPKTLPARTTVSFRVLGDPTQVPPPRPGSDPVTMTTIAGNKAAIQASRAGCRTQIVWDPQTTITGDARAAEPVTSVQVVEIQAASCDGAQDTADTVLAGLR